MIVFLLVLTFLISGGVLTWCCILSTDGTPLCLLTSAVANSLAPPTPNLKAGACLVRTRCSPLAAPRPRLLLMSTVRRGKRPHTAARGRLLAMPWPTRWSRRPVLPPAPGSPQAGPRLLPHPHACSDALPSAAELHRLLRPFPLPVPALSRVLPLFRQLTAGFMSAEPSIACRPATSRRLRSLSDQLCQQLGATLAQQQTALRDQQRAAVANYWRTVDRCLLRFPQHLDTLTRTVAEDGRERLSRYPRTWRYRLWPASVDLRHRALRRRLTRQLAELESWRQRASAAAVLPAPASALEATPLPARALAPDHRVNHNLLELMTEFLGHQAAAPPALAAELQSLAGARTWTEARLALAARRTTEAGWRAHQAAARRFEMAAAMVHTGVPG